MHWESLRYLERANRFSKTAGALVTYLGLTKGTVSQTLKALESKGLVKKQADPKDRRRVRLTLTAKGKRCLRSDPLRLTEEALSALPATTRAGLAGGLESLLSACLAAQGRRPFGTCRDCVYFSRNRTDATLAFCELLEEPLDDVDANSICHEQRPAP